MKRLLLLACLLGVFASFASFASPAHATVPCWKKVVNDWYVDGKIASTYPTHCYNDAYSHLKTDELVYSSLGDDIHRALAAAIARKAGKKVPAQVGKGFGSATMRLASARDRASNSPNDRAVSPTAAPAGQTSGSSVPLPLLVLGGLALALIAVGSIGAVVRRRRLG